MPGSDARCPNCKHALVYFDGAKQWTCINTACTETHPKPA